MVRKGKKAEGPPVPLRRSTRQRTRNEGLGSASLPIPIPDSPQAVLARTAGQDDTVSNSVNILPSKLPKDLPGLTKKGVELLHYKQQSLRSPTSQVHHLYDFCDFESESYPVLKESVDATLVFAQKEAGTAISISNNGLLLTCSHCVAENSTELDMSKIWWLLFASGQIVQARIIRWDPKRDIALLQITAAQVPPNDSISLSTQPPTFTFPFVQLAPRTPLPRTDLLCVGHPGSEDLENGRPGIATGYDVLHISEGKFRGYSKGQNVQDNSEIGALMHDCWTYWGHSGAPLLEKGNGKLVGLHSSWDDSTGMRRGVGWECLEEFLREFGESRKGEASGEERN